MQYCTVKYSTQLGHLAFPLSARARSLIACETCINVAPKLRSVLSTCLPSIAVRKIHTLHIPASCYFPSAYILYDTIRYSTVHTNMHACTPAYIHTYLHTYICTIGTCFSTTTSITTPPPPAPPPTTATVALQDILALQKTMEDHVPSPCTSKPVGVTRNRASQHEKPLSCGPAPLQKRLGKQPCCFCWRGRPQAAAFPSRTACGMSYTIFCIHAASWDQGRTQNMMLSSKAVFILPHPKPNTAGAVQDMAGLMFGPSTTPVPHL